MQQIHVNGYIDVPDRWEFPEIDQLIDIKNVTVEVKGEKTMKNKTSGEASSLKHTLETRMLAGATVGKILPPAPNVEGQTAL
jgi:hypothetical protein